VFMLSVLFGAGFVAAVFSRAFNLPIIPFLVLSGLISSVFVDFEPSEMLLVGILFLIFYIGLRTDLQGFRKISADSMNIAMAQIIIVGSIGFLIAELIGLQTVESLYIGLAAAIGSTLAGTDLFDQKMRMDLHHGKISTGTNLVQDIMAVVLITAIASQTMGEAYINTLMTVALLVGALVIRYFASPVIQVYLKTVELQALFVISVFSLSASIGYYTGISMVASCFAGGLAFSKGLRTDEFLDSVEYIKDFFAVITFVGIGALVSIQDVTSIYLAAAILALVMVLRPLIIFFTALLDNKSSLTAFKISLNLSEVSEFVLAAVLLAFLENSISNTVFESVVIAMAVSMIIVGLASHRKYYLFEKITGPVRKLRRIRSTPSKKLDLKNHIILAGFGGIGANIAEELQETGHDFVVIDYKKSNIEEAEINHYERLFADLTDYKTWENANYKQAKIIVVTTTNSLVLEKIKELKHQAIVLVESKQDLIRLEEHDHIQAVSKDQIIDNSLKELLQDLLFD